MTSHARKHAAMAHRASGLVEIQLAGAVKIQKMKDVVRRLQLGVFGVTDFTGKGVFDLRVADQAIGHLRQRRVSHLVGLFQAAVARFAGVLRVQVAADVARRLKINPDIDCFGQEGLHIAHLQVQGVTKVRHEGVRRCGDGGNLILRVAIEADFSFGQQIVVRLGTGSRSGVALGALQLHFEVDAMRKGRGTPRRAPSPYQENKRFQMPTCPCS